MLHAEGSNPRRFRRRRRPASSTLRVLASASAVISVGAFAGRPVIPSRRTATSASAALRASIRSPASSPSAFVRSSSAASPSSDLENLVADLTLADRLRDQVHVHLTKYQRVVSIGDVHGDLRALMRLLVASLCVDKNMDWIGGDSVLVQVGDILDRGDSELACLRVLCRISRQAEEAGGQVLVLLGNHEVLNGAGRFNYATSGGNKEFDAAMSPALNLSKGTDRWRLQYGTNEPGRWAACEPGSPLAPGLWSRMKVSVVVGRTAFVHAGLTAQHVREYGGIRTMNSKARKWFLERHGPDDASSSRRAGAALDAMPIFLRGGTASPSPIWMRDYSQPPDAEPSNPDARRMMREALAAISEEIGTAGATECVERMVMGHTVQKEINVALGGRAWRIDVGASAGVAGGVPEVLEVVHGGMDGRDVVGVLGEGGKWTSARDRQVVDFNLF